MTYRVLVVDDHELWRSYIGSVLQNDPRWEIVGEASDGLEAVQKAQVLKPDLILSDVTLPTLTGLDVARRILGLDPNARILFLSEHRSWDIVEAALGTKARGYIVKSEVGSDLPSALEAILDGRRFISTSVLEPALRRPTREPSGQHTRRHEAAFHTDETALLDDYARFAGSALETGHAVILAASRLHLKQIRRRLHARGLDTDRAIKEGRYLPLDVADMLSTFMSDGRFDDARFLSAATSLLMKAASAAAGKHFRVAVCGDGAGTLWREGAVETAIRVEQLWDQLSRTYNIDVFCGYLMPASGDDQHGDAFRRICAEHSSVRTR